MKERQSSLDRAESDFKTYMADVQIPYDFHFNVRDRIAELIAQFPVGTVVQLPYGEHIVRIDGYEQNEQQVPTKVFVTYGK